MTDFTHGEILEVSDDSNFGKCHSEIFLAYIPEEDKPYLTKAFPLSSTINQRRYARRPHPDIQPGQPFLGFRFSESTAQLLTLSFFDEDGCPVDTELTKWFIWEPLQYFDYTKPYDIREERPCQNTQNTL